MKCLHLLGGQWPRCRIDTDHEAVQRPGDQRLGGHRFRPGGGVGPVVRVLAGGERRIGHAHQLPMSTLSCDRQTCTPSVASTLTWSWLERNWLRSISTEGSARLTAMVCQVRPSSSLTWTLYRIPSSCPDQLIVRRWPDADAPAEAEPTGRGVSCSCVWRGVADGISWRLRLRPSQCSSTATSPAGASTTASTSPVLGWPGSSAQESICTATSWPSATPSTPIIRRVTRCADGS